MIYCLLPNPCLSAVCVWATVWLIHLITFYISFSTVLLIFSLVDSISRSAPEKAFSHYAPDGQKKQEEKLNNELKSSTSFQETFSVTFSNGPRTQTLFQAAVWFVNVQKAKFTTICTALSSFFSTGFQCKRSVWKTTTNNTTTIITIKIKRVLVWSTWSLRNWNTDVFHHIYRGKKKKYCRMLQTYINSRFRQRRWSVKVFYLLSLSPVSQISKQF